MDKISTESFNPEFLELARDITRLGYDGVLYSFIPKPVFINSKVQPVFQCSEGFAPCIDYYLEKNYGNNDFIIRLAFEGYDEPIDWWEQIDAGKVTDSERAVQEMVRTKFGIYHGLTVLVLHGTFAIAGISVVSKIDDADHFQKLKRDSLEVLQMCANRYHTRIIQSNEDMRFFIAPLLENLSETKKNVLRHMMSGSPMKNIPEVYGITQRYAEKVLLTIRREFGDISTNELMYILGMTNMREFL